MNSFLKDYYEAFEAAKIPRKHEVVKDEILDKLYKMPKRDSPREGPAVVGIDPQSTYQCDLLYMPTDGDYEFCLVVVDIATGYTDAEAIPDRTAATTLKAMKKILNRKPLKGGPKYRLECDNGSEFKSDFKKFFINKGIQIRYGKPGRSRQQAFAEARNRTIGKALFQRMAAEELINREKSIEWVQDLPIIVKAINKYLKKHPRKVNDDIPVRATKDTILLDIGDKVRVILDKPREVTGEKIGQNFRATDIRWSPGVSTITNIIFGEPAIMYQIDDKPTSYTYNQLQVVNSSDKLPPTSVLRRHLVDGIVGRKTMKKLIYYKVRWRGFKENDDTWEPKSELVKNPLIKKLIDRFESS